MYPFSIVLKISIDEIGIRISFLFLPEGEWGGVTKKIGTTYEVQFHPWKMEIMQTRERTIDIYKNVSPVV